MGQIVNREERTPLPGNLALMMSGSTAPDMQSADAFLMHEPTSVGLGWRYNAVRMPFDPLSQNVFSSGYSDSQPYASVDLMRYGLPVAIERGFQQGFTPGYWNANAMLPGGINANVNRQDTGQVNVGISKMLNLMGDQENPEYNWQGNVNANAMFMPSTPGPDMKPQFSIMLNLRKDLKP